jgi:site-specific DNA recombinase
MKRCFGYTRVSTIKQGDGVSLEAQRAAIEQFAARNEIKITQWFEERQTAAKGGRPIFGAMLKALRQHKADGVVMHKIDRSARNFADWAKIGDLADAGIDVHFATESLDFRSRGGRLSADIQAVIAADYIRNLRDEIFKGMYGRLKQGLYPWGAPIGYLDNGGGKPKTPDPIMAPLIRELFELYASGQHSIHSLRKEMLLRGLRNAHGKPLSKHGIETVLNNPFYCGIIRIKRTGATYKGIHEPIVSPTLFERVQELKRGKSGKKVTRHNHLYRGLFRCGRCGAAMTPERQKGHVYYRCQTRDCPTKCVREEALEIAILEVLAQEPPTDAQIAIAVECVEEWLRAEHYPAGEKTLVGRIVQVDGRLEALTDALVDRAIDSKTYAKRKELLLLEKARLEEQLREVRQRPVNTRMVRTFLERIKSLETHYRFADPAVKREIVEIAISNRRVHGKSPGAEPANWLRTSGEALAVLSGEQRRTTSRSSRNMLAEHIAALIELACSDEAERLAAVFEEHDPLEERLAA